MKRYYPLFIFLILLSCTEKEDIILGKWKLTEISTNDEDGNIQFEKTLNEKFITFYYDGKYIIEGTILVNSKNEKIERKGIYKDSKMQKDFKILYPERKKSKNYLMLKIKDKNIYIQYPYDYPTYEKYEKT
ncbi:hypothetical protein J2X97_001690 [Epilithonimonas hungarica]|uniref:hypothetical protein n=1 Tax=Epilithonimonas hungarica TaxID=454006 RepID=UPI00278736CB|nr:hypothetical protein [Epilithonimonas hungarica]MDP9956053.1 hypothetical protein [Epilithonimonas hungarica]